MTATEIKDAMGILPRRSDGKFKSIPRELREQIVAHAKTAGVESIGREFGIHPMTISSWRKKRKGCKGGFRRVEVVSDVQSGLVVEGPKGLKILGLGISDAARLIREVAGEF